jgi:hypothetical protein
MEISGRRKEEEQQEEKKVRGGEKEEEEMRKAAAVRNGIREKVGARIQLVFIVFFWAIQSIN